MNPRKQNACICIVILGLLLAVPLTVKAGQDLPSIILDGLNEYKAKGPDAAVKTWIKGSAFETSVEAQSQGNLFKQVETMYGKYIGYQIVKMKEITKTTMVVYITMDYEKGPVFASFLTYRSGDSSILANFKFNTKPEAVLPDSLLSQ